jgi:hypothetical protein
MAKYIVVIGFMALALFATELYQPVNFSNQDLVVSRNGGYDLIRLKGCELTDEPGLPALPVKPVYVALPPGSTLESYEIISATKQELPGSFFVYPAQPPAVLSLPSPPKRFVAPNPSVYNSTQPYPAKLVTYVGEGTFEGRTILEFLVYPLVYIPEAKKIEFYSHIDLFVRYRTGSSSATPLPRFSNRFLSNPEPVAKTAELPASTFDYLILTEAPLDTVFERLADWKTKKGVKAVVRAVGWVTSHYPGNDAGEKIRNYLKLCHADSGLAWVLLGGDTDIIPVRYAYAMTCSANYAPREDSLPCDLYYSDLDGTWDANHNTLYGEIADSVDLYPDVYVGRAPVTTIADAQTFIDKVLTYERTPPLDYEKNLLFAAMILWPSPYTDAGVGKDMIDRDYVPDDFSIQKLYQSKGNENKTAVLAAIAQGKNLINHDGHGWIDIMAMGPDNLTNADIQTLTNSPRNGILFSIGCWTGAFDFDCIGEEFVKNPSGGGVAYIGNSSYGWGSPGNPGFGYSDRFDAGFYQTLFSDSVYNLGSALALDKIHYLAYSRDANVYRWHQYQLNLLGDPEMMVWTDNPKKLTVSFPDSVPGATPFDDNIIRILVKSNGLPVANALVCIQEKDKIYSRGYTGSDGQIVFAINPTATGIMDLTVTGHNYLPFEGQIVVGSTGPYIVCENIKPFDSDDGDGIVEPDETIRFSIDFKNIGNDTARNLMAILRCDTTWIVLEDTTEDLIASLAPGASLLSPYAFGFKTRPNTPDRTPLSFDLIVAADGDTWRYHPVVRVGTPKLSLVSYGFADSTKISEPGKELSLTIKLKNSGLGNSHRTWARLTSLDPKISVITDSLFLGTIGPDSTLSSQSSFLIKIDDQCPDGFRTYLKLDLNAQGYYSEDSLFFVVGPAGFSDNFEHGATGWTQNDTCWHLSTRKARSPIHSFYCGDEKTGHYENGMNAWLESPPIVIRPQSVLSFYRKFIVPIYGTDGLYVEASDGNGWDTLDFIGTGGALKPLSIPSDWTEERYSLARYQAGDTIHIRFRFISDNDAKVAEGFYLDDIRVESRTGIDEELPPPVRFVLESSPNPFRRRTVIKYEVALPGRVTMKIYNSLGAEVKTFLAAEKTVPGRYSLTWDGTDDAGRNLGSGVYFCRLTSPVNNYTATRKIILLP